MQAASDTAPSPTQFSIAISRALGPLFHVFGFRRAASTIDVEADGLRIRFGSADERVPFTQIRGVHRAVRWPFYFGLGAKFGPDGTVAYVGSTEGLVRLEFEAPRRMNVWGPIDASAAKGVIVSLEEPERFTALLEERIGRP